MSSARPYDPTIAVGSISVAKPYDPTESLTNINNSVGISRIQDADDAPVLGSGQDGFALVWDNATARFVATNTWTEVQTFQAGAEVGSLASDQQFAIYSGNGPAFRFIPNSENTFFGHLDQTFAISWNHPNSPDYVSGRHSWGIHWESDFYPDALNHQAEWYLSYNRATTQVNQRPIAVSMNLDTHTAAIELAAASVGFPRSDGTNTLAAANAENGIFQIYSGKLFYLEETATLGIGVVPSVGGTPLIIARASDGYAAQFTRATVVAGVQLSTTQANIGTTSNHPLGFMVNGSERMQIATTGAVTISGGRLILNGGIPIIQQEGLYGTLSDVEHFGYPGMTTHVNKLRGSLADGGAGNASQNILQWELNNGSNSTNPVLRLQGDKRAMVATPATAPTDANLFAGSISFYLDEAGNKLKVRVKYADGTTLKTGEMSLV